MTTVKQIVDGAAEEIGVKTAEINLEPADFQVILRRMNNMLTEWADLGITPTFNEVFNSTDTVEVERSAVAAIEYNLAVRCAPTFQKIITPALQGLALSTYARLNASTVNLSNVAFPDTLPTGSGNDCPEIFHTDRFFPQNKTENF